MYESIKVVLPAPVWPRTMKLKTLSEGTSQQQPPLINISEPLPVRITFLRP